MLKKEAVTVSFRIDCETGRETLTELLNIKTFI
jgi:hypothetical protein